MPENWVRGFGGSLHLRHRRPSTAASSPEIRRAVSRVKKRLRRLSNRAAAAPTQVFDDLSHYVDLDLLRVAFHRSKKGMDPGRKRGAAVRFAHQLDDNLSKLLRLFREETYEIPASREVHTRKSGGGVSVLYVPPFRDRVLQRAIALILTAVFEPGFSDCSFGYRPRRSPQQALARLHEGLSRMTPCHVLDLDVRACFDSIDRRTLAALLDRRLTDPLIRRLIAGWIRMDREGGATCIDDDRSFRGITQGAVISPLLANVFLDEVLDRWFGDVLLPKLWGTAHLVRYADDAVILFSDELEARQQQFLLPKRFRSFGMELNRDKTKLIRFGPGVGATRDRARPYPESFDFLGFTHYWVEESCDVPVIRRKMSHLKFWKHVGETREWCREYASRPLLWQHRELRMKLEGVLSYYRIADDRIQLEYLTDLVGRAWHHQVLRRAGKSHSSRRRLLTFFSDHPLAEEASVWGCAGRSVGTTHRFPRSRATD